MPAAFTADRRHARAAGRLMAEVLEIHLRETKGVSKQTREPSVSDNQMDHTMKILRAYLRSCPMEWCSFGVRRAVRSRPGVDQFAAAGRLMIGSSLIVAMVSSVM